jgi:hypothetical protein
MTRGSAAADDPLLGRRRGRTTLQKGRAWDYRTVEQQLEVDATEPDRVPEVR